MANKDETYILGVFFAKKMELMLESRDNDNHEKRVSVGYDGITLFTINFGKNGYAIESVSAATGLVFL